MFFACFGAVLLNAKNGAEGHRASFLVFRAHSKAVSRCIKNEAENTGPFFVIFVAHLKAVPLCINEAEGHRAHQRRGQRGPAELRPGITGSTLTINNSQRRELHHGGQRVHRHADGLGRSNRGELCSKSLDCTLRPRAAQAKARLKELYPSKPGWPDTMLVISRGEPGPGAGGLKAAPNWRRRSST